MDGAFVARVFFGVVAVGVLVIHGIFGLLALAIAFGVAYGWAKLMPAPIPASSITRRSRLRR